jgi:FkbM family methyltransferase
MNINALEYIKFLEFSFTNKINSPSQLSQDLFALYFSKIKKDGIYIEIGSCDGIRFSNSLKLEQLGWNGIICEPSPYWHKRMKDRKCVISKKAVFSKSGLKLKFEDVEKNPELSGLSINFEKDSNSELRKNTSIKEVETITLNDLIEDNLPNKNIDYISIDTEGSEFEIIKNFNFNRHKVEIFTIEHNFIEKKRNDIFKLLTTNNYIRIFQNLSKWDDWYIKKDNQILLSMIKK